MTKSSPVGAALFRADKRTDMTCHIVYIRLANLSESPIQDR